ncbi:sensor histidine kinase [Agromyces sp. CFH 90414]|uniref:histidine kinase n=1 Tax=Agromyces agglutinans TaxID=2662258 RepID=A0A6I2F673_9MICO|nr:sensor histidine kinase [Agromyces agglutinans]MRG60202.1 sensor histidine kinase [Agromyces agglutinans]
MTSPVRAWWAAPAASPPPPRRVWRDWVLVAIVPAVALLEASLRTDVAWRWLWAGVLIALVPTLLWRRAHPLAMLAIAFAAGTLMSLVLGAEPELGSTAYFLILVYAVMRWGSGRATVVGGALLVAGTLASLPFGEASGADLVGGLAVLVTTATLGLAFRWRAGARAREVERIRLLEREQLARDLHDTVAHHVSAIAIQAQAGTAVAPVDPDAAARALVAIEGEASRTLDELRAMVRVLRADEPSLMPVPGLDEVRGLAGGDPDVVVRIEGGDAPQSLPPAIGAAVFRIAQEAVTNARRHARNATRVDVLLRIDPAGVRLEVHDDGTGAASASPGYGLRGMAERAALLGGTCTAGARPGGGWTVTAVLPRTGW